MTRALNRFLTRIGETMTTMMMEETTTEPKKKTKKSKVRKERMLARRAARLAAWAKSVDFVKMAAVNPADPDHPAKERDNWHLIAHIFAAPAPAPDATWMPPEAAAETPKQQQAHTLLVATDGFRLHAALVPEWSAAWLLTKPYNGVPDIAHVINSLSEPDEDCPRRGLNINLAFLSDAIHPDAATLRLTFGGELQPVEVFSFLEDGTQVSYAMLMPFLAREGRHFGQRPMLPAREGKQREEEQTELGD